MPRRSHPLRVRKQAFQDAVSTWGHPQTRSQAGLEPTTGKATGAPSLPPVNPAIRTLIKPAQPGTLIQKHAGQRERLPNQMERPGELPGRLSTSRGAPRPDSSGTPGSGSVTPFPGGRMPGRRHSTLLGENVFLHKQFITKGGKRRKRHHGLPVQISAFSLHSPVGHKPETSGFLTNRPTSNPASPSEQK